MRKIKIIFGFLLFALVFGSCSADDIQVPGKSGYIQVEGANKSSIKTAILLGFKAKDDTDENRYNFTFTALEGTTTKNISLDITFPYGSVVDGTYTLTDTSRILDDFLSSYSEFLDNNSIQSYNELTEGTVTVKKIDNKQYEVTFSVKPNGFNLVSGYFKGTVEENIQ
jgi:hypothetical protein